MTIFLDKNFLNKVLKEFPEFFNDKIWHSIPIFVKIKKVAISGIVSNHQFINFSFLNSNKFNDLLGKIFRSKIYSDQGSMELELIYNEKQRWKT